MRLRTEWCLGRKKDSISVGDFYLDLTPLLNFLLKVSSFLARVVHLVI